MKKYRVITRRDFLCGSVYTALSAQMGLSFDREARAEEKAKVVLVRDERVTDQKGKINAKILLGMLDKGVSALIGLENTLEAWRNLIKPGDTVGVKSNAWNPLPTPKELEEAIQQRVLDVGV